jgi:hypothetical protein
VTVDDLPIDTLSSDRDMMVFNFDLAVESVTGVLLHATAADSCDNQGRWTWWISGIASPTGSILRITDQQITIEIRYSADLGDDTYLAVLGASVGDSGQPLVLRVLGEAAIQSIPQSVSVQLAGRIVMEIVGGAPRDRIPLQLHIPGLKAPVQLELISEDDSNVLIGEAEIRPGGSE